MDEEVLADGCGAAATAPQLPFPCDIPERTAAAPSYSIEIVRDLAAVRSRVSVLAGDSASTLFQRPAWLKTWYAAFGQCASVEALLVVVADRTTGRHVLTLPMIRHAAGGLRVITFADCGVTDYNAPILGPAAPASREATEALWARIVDALPRADLIELTKMPAAVQGRPNPMALLGGAYPSSNPSFAVTLPDDWEAYRASLGRGFRQQLGRSLRLFEKEAGTSFRQVEDVAEATRVLAVMDVQQRARMEQLGYPYELGSRESGALYTRLVTEGLTNGTTLLTTLNAGDMVVAALLGIVDGKSFSMMRVSHADGPWLKMGLGRLVIERTMHLLHAKGYRHIDFSIGDFPYKSGFGATAAPLYDLVSAQSWRGKTRGALRLTKATVKRSLDWMGISLVPKEVKDRYRRYHEPR